MKERKPPWITFPRLRKWRADRWWRRERDKIAARENWDSMTASEISFQLRRLHREYQERL